jgi:hypothetical protein
MGGVTVRTQFEAMTATRKTRKIENDRLILGRKFKIITSYPKLVFMHHIKRRFSSMHDPNK